MLQVRSSRERGHFNHGWLDTYHTFSFSEYYDPAHMSFRSLRVMNEDRVAPGQGFGMHGHRDMEIITYVLAGELEHADSMGNGEVLRAGEFQHMTAGSGIQHSEFNPSKSDEVHLYQIWLLPKAKGLTPSYDQRRFDDARSQNQFGLVARGENPSTNDSHDHNDDVLVIQQDANLYLAKLEASKSASHSFAETRHGWLQVLSGTIEVTHSDKTLHLSPGDGLAISDESNLTVTATSSAELLLFDLA